MLSSRLKARRIWRPPPSIAATSQDCLCASVPARCRAGCGTPVSEHVLSRDAAAASAAASTDERRSRKPADIPADSLRTTTRRACWCAAPDPVGVEAGLPGSKSTPPPIVPRVPGCMFVRVKTCGCCGCVCALSTSSAGGRVSEIEARCSGAALPPGATADMQGTEDAEPVPNDERACSAHAAAPPGRPGLELLGAAVERELERRRW
eukprot:363205-Chlamydomonas_euryale.AAC.18